MQPVFHVVPEKHLRENVLDELVPRNLLRVCCVVQIVGEQVLFPVSDDPKAETIPLEYAPYIGRLGLAPAGAAVSKRSMYWSLNISPLNRTTCGNTKPTA